MVLARGVSAGVGLLVGRLAVGSGLAVGHMVVVASTGLAVTVGDGTVVWWAVWVGATDAVEVGIWFVAGASCGGEVCGLHATTSDSNKSSR